MPAPRERDLLVRAARLYYLDNHSQQQVASALGVSRSNVSRMLAAARDQGIVEIRINDPAGREPGLEDELRSAFGLTACRVAATRTDEPAPARVGELAAARLLETVRPGDVLALAYGRALRTMVDAVRTDRPIRADVLPLVGGLTAFAPEFTGEELVRDLAVRLGGGHRRLHAPALLGTKASRDTLMAEPAIDAVLRAAAGSTLAFTGIGAAGTGSAATLVDALRLSGRERARFERARPVGEVCARFFDEDGRPVRGAVADRVLGVTLEDLRRIRTVVGLAAGVDKTRAVLGALRGRYLDVVVCDAPLARALLTRAA